MKYVPHDYQQYATDYIETHPIAAVLLDMGLGKTAITLTALLNLLFDSFEAHRILVIAPLRVARDTWPAEIEKWDHLQMLTYSVAVGTEKERKAALMRDADIYIINRENVQWLIEQSTLPFDFDTVIVDELSSFKSHQSKRFKALIKVRPRIRRIVGLTGTPSANGLMDCGQNSRFWTWDSASVASSGCIGITTSHRQAKWPDHLFLSAPARCRQGDLSENLRYHHFHESSGPPKDAGARYEQLRSGAVR